jgi:hypothetical protein
MFLTLILAFSKVGTILPQVMLMYPMYLRLHQGGEEV